MSKCRQSTFVSSWAGLKTDNNFGSAFTLKKFVNS